MASKTLILLAVFAFLLVVSEIAVASGTVNSENKETVQPDGYGGGVPKGGFKKGRGGRRGHGGRGGGGHGAEADQTQPGH
ncbi:hypothetical protein AALP_AA5G045200 [Arabis alpina]|uniref:Glycine-rich protein n=1 Tax=Arabis alpina TaxID=50452 RepID=A0A087GUX3_ARAAL|nr:hypothetical protein AALP_AA5G045200 [Arabis alpina]